MERRQDCIFLAPAAMQTAGDASRRESYSFSPFCDTGGFTRDVQDSVVSAIAVLFGIARPLAVAWLVALIIIASFDGAATRTIAHVSQEVFESTPAGAYRDAPAAVTAIRRALRIQATRHDASPHSVFWGPPLPPRRAVCYERVRSGAPTTLGPRQVVECHLDGATAGTSTRPDDRTSTPLGGSGDSGQPTEASPGRVNRPGCAGVSATEVDRIVPYQTAATLSVTGSQRVRCGSDARSARTDATPSYGSARASGEADATNFGSDGQSAECKPLEVEDLRHRTILAHTSLTCFQVVG